MIKACDILTMVVENATEKHASKWKLSDEKLNNLIDACSFVDQIIMDFDCSALEIDVVEDTADIMISVECRDIVMEDRNNHPFFDLIKHGKFFTINNIDGETMRLNFVLDGVWELS